MNEENRYKLKQLIKELKNYKGRHTELVSVYVPAGYSINLILDLISQELGTATNIKSKSTRKNVINALSKILQELKLFKKTPKNGLVIFCGNVSQEEGKEDLRIWIFEPPEPLNQRLYRCDQRFILDPLEDMIKYKNVYGLITIDTKEAAFGLLKGKKIEVLKDLESFVFGKFRAGGQSSVRFERVRENMKRDFFKQVADKAIDYFNKKEIKGIILGGPGIIKETFLEYLGPLKKKVIAIEDLSDSSPNAFYELIDKAQEKIQNEELKEEREIVNKFLKNLAKDNGLSIYGKEDVLKALKLGAVDILLLSENLKKEEIENFEKIAKEYNTKIKLISNETREGKQLWQLTGIGAILRYKMSM